MQKKRHNKFKRRYEQNNYKFPSIAKHRAKII